MLQSCRCPVPIFLSQAYAGYGHVLGRFYKLALSDFGIIFEVNRRTSERRAELARAIPSEEEEGVAKLQVEEGRRKTTSFSSYSIISCYFVFC